MSKQTFTWSPDLGATRKLKPSVHQTKFGDGYEVRVPIGINASPKTWTVKFTKETSTAMQILGFLDDHGGSTCFLWPDPLGVLGTYVCRSWSSNQLSFGVYEVSGDFEQVYEADWA